MIRKAGLKLKISVLLTTSKSPLISMNWSQKWKTSLINCMSIIYISSDHIVRETRRGYILMRIYVYDFY